MLSSALAGFGLGGSLIVAIGAQNTFVLRQGLRREHVGLVVLFCTAVDWCLISAGVGGLAALLAMRPGWLDALSWSGAAFLGWYGLAAWRRAWQPHSLQAGDARDSRDKTPRRRVLLQALAVSLLNPHVYLDTVVLAGAVGARQPSGLAFVLGAGCASTLWFSGLGYGSRLLAPLFARARAWQVLDGAVALTMWVLALSLLTGR